MDYLREPVTNIKWSRGKKLILFPENLSISQGVAEVNQVNKFPEGSAVKVICFIVQRGEIKTQRVMAVVGQHSP